MPFVGIFVFLILVFMGMLFGMYWILGKQARRATDHLSDMSSDYLKKKDDIRKILDESKKESQKLLTQAQEESDQLRKQSLQDAEHKRKEMIEQARVEGERIVREAMEARDTMREELRQAAESKVVDHACQLIRKLLSTRLLSEVHAQWLNELITTGIAQIDKIPSKEEAKEAQVVSAFSLTAEQRKKLQSQLQKTLGFEVELTEEVDPRIVAGLTIKLGHLVLDGSLESKLREAALDAQNTSG